MDAVDTPDATHLRIRLKGPEPLLPLNLGTQQVAHPRHLMQPRIDQGEVMITPSDVGWVSTGPFKVTQYDKGSRIQYKRHDGYWEKDAQGNKLPYLDGISMPYVRDANAMDNAFIGGQIDAGIRNSNFALSKTRLDTYRKNLGSEKFYLAQIGFNPYGLHFNVLKSGPFQDVRVRKAVAMWIDQAGMTEVLGGFAQAETFLRPTVSRGGIGMAHDDARVIDLFEQMKAVLPDEARTKAIYSQIQKYMILEQPYVVPTFSQLYEIPYRSYVQGVFPPAENTYHNLDFATVWLDK